MKESATASFVGLWTADFGRPKILVVDRRHLIQVTDRIDRPRLDEYLCDSFSGLSRMYIRDVIKREDCEVNGRIENRGYRLRQNDLIEITVDESRQAAMQPEVMHIDILYEDAGLMVIDKPAGMLVHPTHRDKSGTLLNGVMHYLNENGKAPKGRTVRPGLVHRLDRQTSGLMVIAKNTRCHRILAAQFRRRTVSKVYAALVDGAVEREDGVIDLPIGRYAEKKFWDVMDGGKPAETRFRVVERLKDRTLLELIPVTGRTNQLRIHCAAIGHSIVGDTARGGSEHERLCLHAALLEFVHPDTREKITFDSPATFA